MSITGEPDGEPMKVGVAVAGLLNYRLPPPRLGEHTEELLKEVLGYSSERISDLKERQVI